jgi:hypothetical protein
MVAVGFVFESDFFLNLKLDGQRGILWEWSGLSTRWWEWTMMCPLNVGQI